MENEGSGSGYCSPVPYLIGGIAAMVFLVALALGVLLCSSWKLSSHPAPATSALSHSPAPSAVVAELEVSCDEDFDMPRTFVVMAGDKKPTYLAMPASAS